MTHELAPLSKTCGLVNMFGTYHAMQQQQFPYPTPVRCRSNALYISRAWLVSSTGSEFAPLSQRGPVQPEQERRRDTDAKRDKAEHAVAPAIA